MKRRTATCVAALLCAWNLSADVPVIRVDDPIPEPEVKATGAVLRIPDARVNNRENTPAGAIAARVAESGILYEWTPSPDENRITGGADLTDAALSSDESLLAVLENVGGREFPNGSRVICFNLLNDRLVRVMPLVDRRVARLVLVPDSVQAAALQVTQAVFDQLDRLLLLDLAAGTVTAESQPFDSPAVALAASPQQIFVALQSGNFVLAYQVDDLTGSPLKIRTLIEAPGLLISPDRSRLILFGAGRMEVFLLTAAMPELETTVSLPQDFVPVRGIAVSEDASAVVLAEAPGRAMLIQPPLIRKIADRATGTGAWRMTDGKLLLGLESKDAVSVYTMPHSTTPEATVSPGELRPFNKNRIIHLFALNAGTEPEAVLLDHRGNITRITVKPRRWQKKIIFTPAE